MNISDIEHISKKLDSMEIHQAIFINKTNPINNIHTFNDCIFEIRRFSKDTYIFLFFNLPTASSLELGANDFPRITNHQFYFLNRLMKIKKNSIKYVFHTLDECPILKYLIFDFYSLKENNGIELNNIFLSGSDFYAKYYISKMNKKYRTPLFNYSLKWDMINHTGIDSIEVADSKFLSKDVKKYKTTCLFGRIDSTRIKFSYNLYKIGYYTDNNLYTTFSNQYDSSRSIDNVKFAEFNLRRMGIDSNDISDFIKESKLGYHHESEELLTPEVMRFVPDDNDSYLWITAESIPTIHDIMFITEKTLKAFLWYKPLLLYAVPNTIKLLKHIGFIDVFELMGFDTSYDFEEDDDIRLNKIILEIDKFQKTPKMDIHDKYHDSKVQSALIHNNLLVKKLIGNEKNLHKRGNETATNKSVMAGEYLLNKKLSSNNNKNKLNDKFDDDIKIFFQPFG